MSDIERIKALQDLMEDFEKLWPTYKKAGLDKGAALNHYTNMWYLARSDSFLAEMAFSLRTLLSPITEESKEEASV